MHSWYRMLLFTSTIYVYATFDEVLIDWDYNNITHWHEVYPDCKSRAQSPVNVVFPASQSIDGIIPLQFNFPPLSNFTIDEVPTYSARISNDDDGLTEQLIVPPGTLLPAGIWHFETGHFHWGPTPAAGSEHTINGRSFPMELHLIHRNHKYDTLEQAFKKPDGLLVLGVMFQLHEDNNTYLSMFRLEELTENVTTRVVISGARVGWKNLLPADAATNYATYEGSLTTPPCSEVVRWVVFPTPLNVSEYQLDLLRHIVPGNVRPTQPYNGRKVQYSWSDQYTQLNGASMMAASSLAVTFFVLWY